MISVQPIRPFNERVWKDRNGVLECRRYAFKTLLHIAGLTVYIGYFILYYAIPI